MSKQEARNQPEPFSQEMAGTILTVFQELPQEVWRNASGGDLANAITRRLQAAGYRKCTSAEKEQG